MTVDDLSLINGGGEATYEKFSFALTTLQELQKKLTNILVPEDTSDEPTKKNIIALLEQKEYLNYGLENNLPDISKGLKKDTLALQKALDTSICIVAKRIEELESHIAYKFPLLAKAS